MKIRNNLWIVWIISLSSEWQGVTVNIFIYMSLLDHGKEIVISILY